MSAHFSAGSLQSRKHGNIFKMQKEKTASQNTLLRKAVLQKLRSNKDFPKQTKAEEVHHN